MMKHTPSDSYSAGQYILIALSVLSLGLAIAFIGFIFSGGLR